MRTTKPKVLLVDNYDSFTFNVAQILEEHGGCSVAIRKNDDISCAQAALYDGFLFSPGPGIPSGAPVMAELLNAFQREKCFLGICLGHQAIADAFGMRLVNLGAVRHGVRTTVRVIDPSDYLFAGMPLAFEAGVYHSWAVVTDDDGSEPPLRVTALSDDGVIMALAHVRYDLRGVQFHPESYIAPACRMIIHNWLNHVIQRAQLHAVSHQ
jgi:anthranilate synthase component II